jgi:hypothetical protein
MGRDGMGRDGMGRDGMGRDGMGRDWLDRPVDELDAETAIASGNAPPTEVAAGFALDCSGLSPELCHRITVTWKATSVNPASVVQYLVYRFAAGEDPRSASFVATVPRIDEQIDYAKLDLQELSNGSYTYFVIAEFQDPAGGPNFFSGPSNFSTVVAVNDAPVANPDSYNVNQGATLNVPARGVLGNDADRDSPTLTAELVSGPSHGALALNGDGSFTYTPAALFFGADTFTYVAKDVDPTRTSHAATVTINVLDVTPPAVTLAIPPPTGSGGYFKTKPVAVTVTASDASGVNSLVCTDNGGPAAVSGGQLIIATDGMHTLLCTATDGAGNAASATGVVMIDTVAPAITITTPADGAAYYLNQVLAANYACSDATSGVAPGSCTGPVASGANMSTSSAGPRSFTVTAVDVAGNSAVKTHAYTVGYNVTLTPLKTSAQQGSAVPVVWQVKDGSGPIISALSTVVKLESVFTGPAPCVASQSGTKETLFSLPDGSTGKSTLRFISPNFQFNWDTTSTSTSPIITGKGCYTVLIYLDDEPSKPRVTTPVQLK